MISKEWELIYMIDLQNGTKTEYTTFSLITSCPLTNLTMNRRDIESADSSSVSVTVSSEVAYADHV